MVRLGFEVGSGAAVDIPLKHVAICGMTQEAGKTTALEGLIARSGLRAVTFVTKRGESAFVDARRIQPYFREQTDWRYVAALLEASRGEKMKMERAFVIRASKGARTLADVHRNVRAALADPKVRGFAADMYLCLDAYLEVVVPQIALVDWAPTLALRPGVNVVDLGAIPMEMQHLIIKSTLDWVLEHEADTVVVIPEAWKFVPQGRGTPVKLSAEALIRQGAALRNYIWLDSQDLGGIEKTILRSVGVWLLGVQREANEIKRTLDNIPAGTAKPSKADIAHLELGQFYACFGRSVRHVYAQPAWLHPDQAQMVARGQLLVPRQPRVMKEETVNAAEAQALKDENAKLREENATLAQRLKALEDVGKSLDYADSFGASRARPAARQDHARDADPVDARERAVVRPAASGTAVGPARTSHPDFSGETENLYQAFKARLLAEVDLNGATVVQITPPEKLRADFQQSEVARLVQTARDLSPLARKTLKLLEGLGKRLMQVTINERLGRSVNSRKDMGQAVALMKELGLVTADGNGVASCLRSKIENDLSAYAPSAADVDACYQQVLYALATEA